MTISTAPSHIGKTRHTEFIAIALAIAFTCVTDAPAQGLINFFNSATTHVTLSSNGVNLGSTPTTLGQFRYELFVAPAGTLNTEAFTGTGVIGTNQASVGRFSGGSNRAVPGVPPGSPRSVLVRGWSANLGANYSAALISYNAGQAGYFGNSSIATNYILQGFDGSITWPGSGPLFGATAISSGFALSYAYPNVITVVTQPVSQSIFETNNATLSVDVFGSSPTYLWRKDGVTINGSTNANLTLTNVSLADAGNYDVVITNTLTSVTSSVAALQILPYGAPSIRVNSQIVVGTVSVGNSASVSLSGGFPGGINFYTLDGSLPTTGSILYGGPVTLTSNATVRAMSLSADFSQMSEAPAVNVVVLPVYALTTSINGTGSISNNPPTSPYISNSVVTLTATGGTNWAFDHWTGDLSGSVNPTAVTMDGPKNVQAVFVPTAYPLTISTLGGGSVTANTQSIAPNTYYPTGSVVSLDATAASGWTFLNWQGTASGTDNPFNIAMTQTQIVQAIFGTTVSTNVAGSGSISMSATNPVPYGSILTNTAMPALGYYFVSWSGAVSGTNNPISFTVTSATPTVGALFAISPSPTIVIPPTNTPVILGNNATFVVQATGAAPLTYQWRKAGLNISGETGTNFTIVSTAATDAGSYDVVVTNGFGGSITSSVATLTMLFPPTITQPPQSHVAIIGSNTTFSVAATGTPTLTYQWQKNGLNIGGAAATNYSLTGVTTNDEAGYTVVITNPYGSITSAIAQLTIVFPPHITVQPTNQVIAAGNSANLTIAATGTEPLIYQWQYNGTIIPTGTNSTLSLNPTLTNQSGSYSVAVSNPYGTATSQVSTLIIYAPVTFTLQPASQIVSLHGTAVFDAVAEAFPAPSYQWQFNGEFIFGANGNSLVITNVGTNLLGDFSVIAWNPYSISTSAIATLFMSPSIQSPFVGATAVWGKSAILSVSAQGSGQLTYQWFKDGIAINSGTNSSLLFPSVLLTDGGLYSVVVTSTLGSVTNTPAQLVVNPANISLGLYAGITVDGVPGFTYGIQYSSDLTDTNSWVTLTNLTLTQPVEVWMDPSVDVHAAGAIKRFYRVIAP